MPLKVADNFYFMKLNRKITSNFAHPNNFNIFYILEEDK